MPFHESDTEPDGSKDDPDDWAAAWDVDDGAISEEVRTGADTLPDAVSVGELVTIV